jgi:hypothetical protein
MVLLESDILLLVVRMEGQFLKKFGHRCFQWLLVSPCSRGQEDEAGVAFLKNVDSEIVAYCGIKARHADGRAFFG